MDPIIFEFLGGLLVGAIAGLMVVLRIKHPAPKRMPMLAVKKTKSTASLHRRRTSSTRDKHAVTVTKSKKKSKTKTPDTILSSQTPNTAFATVSFNTCPSCGLQAPGSLLAEHFLGSPSHRNGLPAVVEADPIDVEAAAEAEEDDSRQSVRNLLQMLVPPRAFGRRHAYKAVSQISPIIKNLGPAPGRTGRP